jgi:hypothetical protein
MSDPSLTASMLELGAQIEELRNAMPKPPATDLSRSEFLRLPPGEQLPFIRRGGQIHNDPPAPQAPLPKNGIRREDFDKLDHAARHRLIKGGNVVVD